MGTNMKKIAIENAMLVDENLQSYLEKNAITLDKEFTGLKWKSDDEIKEMIGEILKGEKKDIYLATTYMEPEFIAEVFAAIHTNVSSVSVFIYDLNAEMIVMKFAKKYPAVKFTLLNDQLGR